VRPESLNTKSFGVLVGQKKEVTSLKPPPSARVNPATVASEQDSQPSSLSSGYETPFSLFHSLSM
jgi:hypothetical protein